MPGRLLLSSRSAAGRGFTLVELLVVIGIIALLLGFLMPALRRARDYSMSTVCQSNLRQIWMATVMYANDNREWFPGPNVTGDYIFRRAPGDKTPGDASSKPEIFGLAAVLHGVKWQDYNDTTSLWANILTIMAQKPRYLAGRSPVWMCPAADDETRAYNNTYVFSMQKRLNGDVINTTTKVVTAPALNTFKRRASKDKWFGGYDQPWVFDNTNFYPGTPGLRGPFTGGGFTTGTTAKSPYLNHRQGNKRYANYVHLDGHFEQIGF